MKTKISVLSQWYNEELLAPLFFRHYGYVDEIRILLETDTNDGTKEICAKHPNVVIEDIHCPEGFDEINKAKNINRAISNVREGWIYVVDADEFIFPEGDEDVQAFLARQKADIVMALNFHVYRHVTENDIDYDKEVISQRIHAQEGENFKHQFIKPSVFRASAGVVLTIGNHGYIGEHSCSDERYIGAHWKLADSEIAIRRRLSNKERMSQTNKKHGYSNHEYHITKERIEGMIRKNSKLPELKYFTTFRREL